MITKQHHEIKYFQTEGKLGVLASCKSDFSISHYLTSDIYPAYKRAVAKIRLSAHKLPIEHERYAKTPRVDRICLLGCDDLGDERHYLLECKHPAIKEVYTPILSSVNILCDEMIRLTNNKDKLIHLLSSQNTKILHLTGKLCHKVLSRFKEITW